MKTYISNIIPQLEQFSKKLDDITLLTNQHWVAISDIDKAKCVFIFRKNKELLISQNGLVEKGTWEYLGNNSLLINRKDGSHLFKHGFFDENVLALKVDGLDTYAYFVNENKFIGELDSSQNIERFLESKYLSPHLPTEVTSREIKSVYSMYPPLDFFGYFAYAIILLLILIAVYIIISSISNEAV